MSKRPKLPPIPDFDDPAQWYPAKIRLIKTGKILIVNSLDEIPFMQDFSVLTLQGNKYERDGQRHL